MVSTRRTATTLTALLLLSLLAGQASAGYRLDFVPRGDTVKHVSPGEVGEFHFTLTNTGALPDVFEFDCRVVAGVAGWTVVYCVGGQCGEPGMKMYDTLPAGATDTAIKVTVYTTATEGEEVVSLRVRSMGDTTLAESIATHTIVGSAIAEAPEARTPQGRLLIVPQPLRAGTPATISFSTREKTRFEIGLYDPSGRQVGIAATGFVGAGRHVVTWRPAPCPVSGVYLLRLTAGRESAVCKLVME